MTVRYVDAKPKDWEYCSKFDCKQIRGAEEQLSSLSHPNVKMLNRDVTAKEYLRENPDKTLWLCYYPLRKQLVFI